VSISIASAINDKRLFGAALGDLSSWQVWLAVLSAAFALPLTAEQTKLFAAVSGGRLPPSRRVRELWCVAGRRSGKSRMAALISCYLGLFVKHKVCAGERPMILCLAGSVDQAKTVFSYVKGFLQASPALRREVANVTAHEVQLKNGVTVAIHSNSFRHLRGRTLAGCVFDECSFWRDESSAQPDRETYSAVLPALATTKGMLVAISTPYRKLGLVFSKWRDGFAVNSADILVVQGPTTAFNTIIDEAEIAAQRAADPAAAISEWDALFRSDVSSFLDDDLIDRAVDISRPLELPPSNAVHRAFTDASGGVGRDSYTFAISHQQDDGYVLDLVRGTPPGRKFDPHEVTKEYASLCREYGVREVVGDNYSREWVGSAWRSCNIEYRKSLLPKSAIYLECVPLFTRALVSLPDHAKLLRELRLLERSTGRSGKDAVDHPRHETDDYCNAALGSLHLCAKAAALAANEPKIVKPFIFNVRTGEEITASPSPHSPHRPSTSEPWWNYVGGSGGGFPGGPTLGPPPGSGRREW
jgi:hypothetical protein